MNARIRLVLFSFFVANFVPVAACSRSGLLLLGDPRNELDADVPDADTPHDAGPDDMQAPPFDAGIDADASPPDDGGPSEDSRDTEPDSPPCDYGVVIGDVMGTIDYFAGGAPLPAGRYRLTYVDGCMKYSSGQGWTVHAYTSPAPPDQWFVVGATSATRFATPPGTTGYFVGEGAFANFDDCVAANLVLSPVEFDSPGGPLGVWVEDDPYTDNVGGVDGRNPAWRLTCAE